MLLANMAVAHHITSRFQDLAVLRRHPPPQTRMMSELVSNEMTIFFTVKWSRGQKKRYGEYRLVTLLQ